MTGDRTPAAGDHQEIAERIALVLTEHGMQRMSARVMAAFLVTERETLTQGDLAELVGAAAGSVSGAINRVVDVGLVERVLVAGSRREHYRLRDEAWVTLFSRQNRATETILAHVNAAIEQIDPDSPARRRLETMRSFYDYLLAELPALLERWKSARESR